MGITEGTAIVLSNNQASADMIRAMMEPSMVTAVTGLILMLIVIGLCWFIFSGFFNAIGYVRKSKEYRKKMTDMYVVGVVKQLAKNDSVNIEEELQKFDKDCLYESKSKKKQQQELDDTIENNLQEEVDAHTEKKLAELKREIDAAK